MNEYIFILENTYVIRRVYPFYKNIRSEISKMPKIFFEDTGLVNILQNRQLLPVLTGQLFENACFSQIRKKYGIKNLYFWRTNTQKEIDFVLLYEGIRALEVKIKNRGKKDEKHLVYFKKYYPEASLNVVSLESVSEGGIPSIFPWEI